MIKYKIKKEGIPTVEVRWLATISKLTGLNMDALYYQFTKKKVKEYEKEGYTITKINTISNKDKRKALSSSVLTDKQIIEKAKN